MKTAFQTILITVLILISMRTFSQKLWIELPDTIGGNGGIYAMQTFQSKLIVGGSFDKIGSMAVDDIATWDGNTWGSANAQISGNYSRVSTMTIWNNELVIAGIFDSINGIAMNNIAKWDGTNWSNIGSGLDDGITDIVVLNGELYATGYFKFSGSNVYAAKWNSSNWVKVGNETINTIPNTIGAYNNEIYVGGGFYPNYGITEGIRRFNGTNWVSVNGGIIQGTGGYDNPCCYISDLYVFNNELILGGTFMPVNGPQLWNLIRWDGTSFLSLSGKNAENAPTDMIGFNGELYYCGTTGMIWGLPNVAKWTGNGMTPLGVFNNPNALEVFNGELYLGTADFLYKLCSDSCPMISGDVYYDLDSNCVNDITDNPLKGWLVKAEPGSYYASTDSNGHYEILPQTIGAFKVSLVPYFNIFTEVCTITDSVTLTPSVYQSNNNDIGGRITLYCPILMVQLHAGSFVRCFSNNIYINYCNIGTDTAINVKVILELVPDILPSNSSVPWTDLGNNMYEFNIGTIGPGNCGWISMLGTVNCSTTLGDTLCLSASISPTSLCDGQINYGYETGSMVCKEIVGSYDPNQKFALNPVTENIDSTDIIKYQIDFQNTGTDTARTIIIEDPLSQFLNPETVWNIASSHPYTFTIDKNNILEWKFENIMLPDSSTDLVGSKGFIIFSVKQKPGNLPGTAIYNYARIYFDFNTPVYTDNVLRKIPVSSSIRQTIQENELIIYPNPFSEYTTIRFSNVSRTIASFTMYNIAGQKVWMENNFNENYIVLKNNAFPPGMYFVEVMAANSAVSRAKIIVK